MGLPNPPGGVYDRVSITALFPWLFHMVGSTSPFSMVGDVCCDEQTTEVLPGPGLAGPKPPETCREMVKRAGRMKRLIESFQHGLGALTPLGPQGKRGDDQPPTQTRKPVRLRLRREVVSLDNERSIRRGLEVSETLQDSAPRAAQLAR